MTGAAPSARPDSPPGWPASRPPAPAAKSPSLSSPTPACAVLNEQYRRKDKPTDVGSRSHLASGDIVIAAGVARRQARDAGHSYAVELKILALHGLLHLLGYDHHDPADGGRMARLERRLRAKGGLRAGLIERAGASRP